MKGLKECFSQDEKIDKATLVSLTNTIKNNTQNYTSLEKKEIENSKEFIKKCKLREEGGHFEEVRSLDKMMSSKIMHIDGGRLVTGFATAVVDASAEECAAWEIRGLNSRSFLRNMKSYGILKHYFDKANDHSFYYLTTRDIGVPGFSHREFRTVMGWYKEGNTIIIYYNNTKDMDQKIPMKRGNILGSVQTTWQFETLDSIGDVPQTRATFTTHLDLKGALPAIFINQSAPNFLSVVSLLRKGFDRGQEVDAFKRQRITRTIQSLPIDNTKANSFNKTFEGIKRKHKVERSFPLSDTWLSASHTGKGWGRTTVTAYTTLEEAAAYFWDFESRVFREVTSDIERKVMAKGEWEQVIERKLKIDSTHGGHHGFRDFKNRMNLYRVKEGKIMITLTPLKVDTESRSKRNLLGLTLSMMNLPRASWRSRTSRISRRMLSTEAQQEATILLTRKGATETKIEFEMKLKLGKGVSEGATKIAIERQLDEIGEVQRYFAKQITLEELNALKDNPNGNTIPNSSSARLLDRSSRSSLQTIMKDKAKEVGNALGLDLVWEGGQLGEKHLRQDRGKLVEKICKESAALREVVKKYPWFVTLLKRARLGELNFNSSVSTKIQCIEEKEARTIGNNLMPCLKSRKVLAAGVDRWRLQNRAVGELFEEFPWMEGMFIAIGKGVIKSAPWGLLLRVCFGAAASMIDLFSDVYVTTMFWNEGKKGFFLTSIISITLSMVLQVVVVWVKNRKLGTRKVLIETFPILIGFKPALDAYRIAKDQKKEVGQIFDAMTELTAMKAVEIIAEAIPGVIIQLMAIATTSTEEDIKVAAWISLATSVLSTSFICATVSYDWDTDPDKREHCPDFYGYVPSNATKRSMAFAAMLFSTAGCLVVKSMCTVLLWLIGGRVVLIFFGIEMSLYLTIKMLRGDFWYWIPAGDEATEMLLSLFLRMSVKLISDFTSIVQFRHPNEVGGAYWLFSVGFNHASLAVATTVAGHLGEAYTTTHLHNYTTTQLHNYTTTHVHNYTEKRELLISKFVVTYIVPFTLLSNAIFFWNINQKYLKTFYSTTKGKDFTVKNFRNNIKDEVKASVLKYSKHHWYSIENEVRVWVETNWEIWKEDKPAWFDDGMQARIPVHFIPTVAGRKDENERRKSIKLTTQTHKAGASKTLPVD